MLNVDLKLEHFIIAAIAGSTISLYTILKKIRIVMNMNSVYTIIKILSITHNRYNICIL